ncbi:hypothetical protein JQK87_13835 [Streptomyces sp. G44]|uniref:hypothetical protein n=1 Tax=Streptomyces sp. G44 TaxID=2807632 RepID=UPI001961949F|nr:hypothetical protein [Streptomyces sp. G44]MBM7169476.1 hypothetical protein [Streptomyces sp. G44]
MPTASDARHKLDSIMSLAHVNTFHPNAFDWSRARTPADLAFLSEVTWGEPGHEDEAIAYIVKELGQLAEIERHVSATMALVLSEMSPRTTPGPLAAGHELHHAVSCFAAEELHHANTFYRYVREISGLEPRLDDGLFTERLAVFQEDDHPYVKLIALCCSAYVGESVVTVFEHRTDHLDPGREYFLTRLLHLHGLDEARHIQLDHFVMRDLYQELTPAQRARTRVLASRIEELNVRLAVSFADLVLRLTGVDVHTVPAARTQLAITQAFASRVFDEHGDPRTADEVLDDGLLDLVSRFSGVGHVHAPPRHGLSLPHHPAGEK